MSDAAAQEERWREFVVNYPVEVSEEAIQNELEYIELDMRHRMVYDRLAGGDAHLSPTLELEEQADELRALAIFEAKEPRVVRAIIEEQGLTVTSEELECEARAMAERQHATLEMVKSFFGEDFSGLARDVLSRKAMEWALALEQ